MIRKTIIYIVLAGLIGVGYWGFVELTSDPLDPSRGQTETALPQNLQHTSDQRLSVEGIDVQPGRKMELTQRDEHTGRATARFRFDTWEPVGDDKRQIRVEKPELTMLMPSRMVAHITAERGQIFVEKVDQPQQRPQRGRLTGGVTITLERRSTLEPQPDEESSEAPILIELENLNFDIDVGELSTDPRGKVDVRHPDFELAGRGLFLEWSQADNRVNQFTLRHGDHLVLFTASDMLQEVAGPSRSATTQPAPTSQNAEPARPTAQLGRKRRRRAGAYQIVLQKNVVANQFAGDQRVGGLSADIVRLLIDLGRGPGEAAATEADAPTSMPTTQPGSTTQPADLGPVAMNQPERNRVVVTWEGPLRMWPLPDDDIAGTPRRRRADASAPTKPRRHFEAVGNPVVIEQQNASVTCGRVEVRDEVGRIWLGPAADGRVHFRRGENVAMTAGSVFIDQEIGLIKLVSDVRLESGARGSSAIACDLWAELRIASSSEQATLAEPLDAGAATDWNRLRRARFVGNVAVQLSGQRLRADELETSFREQGTPDDAIEQLLDTVVATGDVALRDRDGAFLCTRLELAMGHTPRGRAYPQRAYAVGGVTIERGRSRITGDEVTARMEANEPPLPFELGPEPLPVTSQPAVVAKSSKVWLRDLVVDGNAVLRDPRNRVAARGTRIVAAFVGENTLRSAQVEGTADRWAAVYAQPYRVDGATIHLDQDQQAMWVDGPSKLRFSSQRSLRGTQTRSAVPVVVTSRERMRVDVVNDRVVFEGDVAARSGAESLGAERLTLTLRDAAPEPSLPEAERPSRSPIGAMVRLAWRTWEASGRRSEPVTATGEKQIATSAADRLAQRVRPLRQLFGGVSSNDDAGAFVRTDSRSQVRKEPYRLIAVGSGATGETLIDQVVFRTEMFQPGIAMPVATAEIIAPTIEADVPGRQITTRGQTSLAMTSRRMPSPEGRPSRVDASMPVAISSRGPSQSVIGCEQSMTYSMGEAEPDGSRRDVVLFQGDVRFVHVAGPEMVNLRSEVPGLTESQINQLRGRHTDLTSDRLECGFVLGVRPGGASTESGMRLNWMLATGNVQLVDREKPAIRTMLCHQLEFKRDDQLISVRGSGARPAQLTLEDQQRSTISEPFVGSEITIDLAKNEIRAPGRARGAFRR